MILYPAIDLLDGNCVRLYKGDYAQQTTYGDNPIQTAKDFLNAGATWLHIVDLSGAKNPTKRQISLIKEMIETTNLSIQTGGGIRTIAEVAALLECGAQRVVIGSLAVKDTVLTKEILNYFGGERITIALDILNDYIAVSGWQESTKISISALVETYLPYGLTHVLCTDIERDGTLQGPNTTLYQIIKKAYPTLQIQASGGISSLDDIKNLACNNIDGVIVGKAIYEGRFRVSDAIKAVPPC